MLAAVLLGQGGGPPVITSANQQEASIGQIHTLGQHTSMDTSMGGDE